MNKHFSHLVWLGAGSASEPAGLVDIAERVTLVEAREAACLLLEQQYPQENISVKQRLLTVDGASVEFTESNLAEYSAIQNFTGLKTLFPGLKVVNSERLSSTSITDFINDLTLQDCNNLLVADIADSNLALLMALQESGQLSRFSDIRIQAGIEPLYVGAATITEIDAFLQQQGYLLQQTTAHDPDLPWLSFGLNPLWGTLQQTRQANNALNKELEKVKQELVDERQWSNQQSEAAKLAAGNKPAALAEHKNVEIAMLSKGRDKTHSQLSELQQQYAEVTTNFEQQKKELAKVEQQLILQGQVSGAVSKENEKLKQQLTAHLQQSEQENKKLIDKLQSQLDEVSKHASARLEKITQIEKANRNFQETNVQLQKRQLVLEQELLKAEAQIDLIKFLLLKNDVG